MTHIGEKAFYDCDNLTIYGYAGSYAESYANENGIPFVPLYITLYKTGTSEIIPALINTCGSFSWDNIDDNYSCIDMELALPVDDNILVLNACITLPDGFSFEKDSIEQTKTLTLKNKSEGKLFVRTTIYPLYSDADTWEVKYVIDEEEHSEILPIGKSSSSGEILMRPTSIVNGNDVDALEHNIFSEFPNFKSEQAFVLNRSDIYHDELAAVGCMMSQAAYNKNRAEPTDDSYIFSSMHNLGFSQVWFDKNSYIDENGVAHIKPDDVGVGFGTKEVISNGEIYTIVMVAVRGTVDLEWIGNFDVVGNDNTVHNNFQNCANSVMTRFNRYYDSIIGSKTNTKVFICGHSRGGAVADLVAHSLNDRFGSENVYGYTFAAPNSTKNPVADSNIFNYVYKYDIVGFVPQGYGKHGITVVVGGKDKDSCPESVSTAFSRFTKDKTYENVGSDLLVKILLFENEKLNKDITFWKELLGQIMILPFFIQDGYISRGHGAENYCSWVLFNGLKQATFYDDYVKYEKENTELKVKGLGLGIEKFVKNKNVQRILFGLQESLYLTNNKDQKSESFVLCCPIDVNILNEEGGIRGTITNHEGIVISEDLIAFGDGESTYLVIPDDSKYKLVITGNDEGQMSVISVLANEEGYYVKAQSADNIPVSKNEVFTMDTSTSIYSTPSLLSNLGYEYSFAGSLVLSDETATVEIEPQDYTGEPLTPEPIVTFNNETLVEGTDYTLSYSDNINVGMANVIITGIGNYVGEITSTFKINASISSATVSGVESKTYNGKAQTQNLTLKFGSITLKSGTDYNVSYKNNTNAGTATVVITGKGDYTGTITKTFTIKKAAQPITASNLSLTFPKTGTISASGNKGKLTYKSSNTAIATVDSAGKVTAKGAGSAKITITAAATDNYNQATKTITVTVNKANQSIIVKAAASSVAVGKTTTVSLTGNKGSKSFKSSDTAVATVNASTGVVTAKKVGTVKITATAAATANYKSASKTVTIKVVPAATASLTAANQATGIKLTWKKVIGANGYKVYRGSTLIKTITSGSTVTYADTKANTNGTKYTYKVVAKATTGDSTLSKSVAVYRVARPALSSVTNSASKKMTVKWGKNAKANGYQIQYSLSKTFGSGNKAVTITSASTVSKAIGSLTKGKTYYVRIRTYKTVGSTKYWSEWSPAKSVKISK